MPLGEDYGLEWPLGLMDKMMIGDDHAFESVRLNCHTWFQVRQELVVLTSSTSTAERLSVKGRTSTSRGSSGSHSRTGTKKTDSDTFLSAVCAWILSLLAAQDSSIWRSIASSSLDSKDLWLMEGLNRDHNLLAGIEVRRLPLSYLILKSDQSAKYPSELHHALKRNPLLLRSSPELCGDTGKWSCRTCPMCGIMPESTRQEDPGFCSLIATCNRTYTTELRLAHRMARDPRCTEDGTVYMKGQWVEGTARCLFDTLSEVGALVGRGRVWKIGFGIRDE